MMKRKTSEESKKTEKNRHRFLKGLIRFFQYFAYNSAYLCSHRHVLYAVLQKASFRMIRQGNTY